MKGTSILPYRGHYIWQSCSKSLDCSRNSASTVCRSNTASRQQDSAHHCITRHMHVPELSLYSAVYSSVKFTAQIVVRHCGRPHAGHLINLSCFVLYLHAQGRRLGIRAYAQIKHPRPSRMHTYVSERKWYAVRRSSRMGNQASSRAHLSDVSLVRL